MHHQYPPGFTEEELAAIADLSQTDADFGHNDGNVEMVPSDDDQKFATRTRYRRLDDPDSAATSIKRVPLTTEGRLWLRYEDLFYAFMQSKSGIGMFEVLCKTPATLTWEWNQAKAFLKSARNYTPGVPVTLGEIIAATRDTLSRVVACESNPANAILCLRRKNIEHTKLTEHIHRVLDVNGPTSFFIVNNADDAMIEALFRLYAHTKEHVPSTFKTTRNDFVDALSKEFPQLDVVETQTNTYLVRHAH